MTKATVSEKKAFHWGVAYSFRGLVHHRGGEHGSMQKGVVAVGESFTKPKV